jgi:hypothetical protein
MRRHHGTFLSARGERHTTKPVAVQWLAMMLITLLGGTGFATHEQPAKGKKAMFALVNSYLPCGAPNTSTNFSGIPACTPPVLSGICHLSPTGSGKVTFQTIGNLTASTEELKIVVVANGLTAACEGDTLTMLLSFHVTSDDCPAGSCTTTDVNNFELADAFCTVQNGRCRISTTLNTAYPGLLPIGRNTGITLLGCGLKRALDVNIPLMECGVLLS